MPGCWWAAAAAGAAAAEFPEAEMVRLSFLPGRPLRRWLKPQPLQPLERKELEAHTEKFIFVAASEVKTSVPFIYYGFFFFQDENVPFTNSLHFVSELSRAAEYQQCLVITGSYSYTHRTHNVPFSWDLRFKPIQPHAQQYPFKRLQF